MKKNYIFVSITTLTQIILLSINRFIGDFEGMVFIGFLSILVLLFQIYSAIEAGSSRK